MKLIGFIICLFYLSIVQATDCKYCDSLYVLSRKNYNQWEKYTSQCLKTDTIYYANGFKVKTKETSTYYEVIKKDTCGFYFSYALKPTYEKEDSDRKEYYVYKGDTTYTMVDVNPEFIGGNKAMINFLNSTLIYPNDAVKNRIEGVVWIKFTIERTGVVTNVELIKGFHPSCDNEALKAVEMMPYWRPAMCNNRPVASTMKIPIRYALPEEIQPKTDK